MNQAHVQKEAIFQRPFKCPECCRQKKDDVVITGEEEWYCHVGLFHGEPEENHRSLDNGKRERDEEDVDTVESEAAAGAVCDEWAAVDDEWAAVADEWVAGDDEWFDDAIADVTITTPDTFTDSTLSGSQSPTTPTSSESFDDIRNFDPRILADEAGKGWKRTKVHGELPIIVVGEGFEVSPSIHLAQEMSRSVVM